MNMRVALIGKGRWGTNIFKTLQIMGVEVVIAKRGAANITDIDGVIIATPSSSHAQLALPYIKKRIPVFIEKPMTTSAKDAGKILAAAKKFGALVFVGHIYLYNPAFMKVPTLLPKLGKLRYIVSEKMNFGPREGESVFWDWLPHDLSMGISLFGMPRSVDARGFGARVKSDYNFGVATYVYGNVPYTSIVHWRSTEKRKVTTFVGERATLVFDDGADKKLLLQRGSKITYPAYETEMPLVIELREFIDAIQKKKIFDLSLAYAVVTGVEAAQRSAVTKKIVLPNLKTDKLVNL